MDNEKYLLEVHEALERDDTRLGEVWRGKREGKSPADISEELNVSTSGFVYTYLSYIRTIIDGDVSRSPTMAKQIRGALRSFGLNVTTIASAMTLFRHLQSVPKSVIVGCPIFAHWKTPGFGSRTAPQTLLRNPRHRESTYTPTHTTCDIPLCRGTMVTTIEPT